MSVAITSREFQELADLMRDETGIALSPTRSYLVENRLTKLLIELRIDTFEDLIIRIKKGSTHGLMDRVIDAMTTNETSWFRDPAVWAKLRDQLLPRMRQVAKREERKLRIWSAACSTGQEPYSLALLAHDEGWGDDLEVVGTDISSSSLFVAMSGRYHDYAMSRGFVGQWMHYRERFFDDAGGGIHELRRSVRQSVKFRKLNLSEALPEDLGRFDLVMLRNVVYYLSPQTREALLQEIAKRLRWRAGVMLGETETLVGTGENYVQEPIGGLELLFPRRELSAASRTSGMPRRTS